MIHRSRSFAPPYRGAGRQFRAVLNWAYATTSYRNQPPDFPAGVGVLFYGRRVGARQTGWQVPALWWRRGEAFHGRSPQPRSTRPRASTKAAVTAVAAKEAAIDDLLVRTAGRFGETVDHPESNSELSAAAHAFVDGRFSGTGVTPTGAAVTLTVVTDQPEHKMRVPFVDFVIGRFGAVFAAEMLAEAVGVELVTRELVPDRSRTRHSLGVRDPDDLRNVVFGDSASRVRTALAALPADDYANAVDRLAPQRGARIGCNLLTSFLFPTQHEWVAADIARSQTVHRYYRSYCYYLLASVDSVESVEKILALEETRDHAIWSTGMSMNFVYALCANIGPGVEPFVAELFEGNLSAQHKKWCAGILGEIDTDSGFEHLVSRLGSKYIEPAVIEAIARSPERAARLLADASGPEAERLRRDLEHVHPESAMRKRVSGTTLESSDVPALLRDPPWLDRAESMDRGDVREQVFRLESPPAPLRVAWRGDEQRQWAEAIDVYVPYLGRRDWPEVVAAFGRGTGFWSLHEISYAPEHLLRPVLSYAPTPRYAYRGAISLGRLLARFEGDALDFVLRAVLAAPAGQAQVLLPVVGGQLTTTMLEWLGKKSLRPVAFEWFDRHIDSATSDLVPLALGRTGPSRTLARRALCTLARRGHRDAVVAAGRSYGAPADAAIVDIVDADPLLDLPRHIPVIPDWLDPALLPPLTLQGERAQLPSDAIRTICTMFSLSRMDEVYAGVDIVRELVGHPELAKFVWDMFERWLRAGAPEAQSWTLDALGIVGDDDTARQLTPLIRTWPLQSAHRRAAMGLEALAMIGSDAALGHLWSISQSLRFPALRAKADKLIHRIADELNLTPLELADRLVPNLGLDADGTTTFDYGDRTFTLTFDHELRIVVEDNDGRVRDRVPRPGRTDSDGAREEYRRYTDLRKDLEGVRTELVSRFEKAMVNQRRWTLSQVRTHLVGHPLTWHLCSALVWSTTDGRYFRFSELRRPVGPDGRDIEVADGDLVVVAHPATMGDSLGSWTFMPEQAFEQVRREVFRTDVAAEMAALKGRKTTTDQLLALGERGWKREDPQDKGAQISLNKRLDSTTAVIMAFPGFNVSNPRMWGEQKIVHVFHSGLELSVIAASELLRDLAMLETEPIRGDEPDLRGEP
ncbi:hypothetical protein CH306_04690 [Rhodococcus sp. 15-725-2-2b]|nr:hypothetical protein CH277_23925 [Rhodococcus sp. 06-469-3-2]OZD49793.1 hypothetical protein CH264_03760 [Rhodococcus sp. 06-1477-1A]OZE77912.1 hypothetical protein CH306_04690 [Rhodococcus sp. 15-725-2-2b]